MLVDSHCHLDRIDLTPYDGDLKAAIAAARERGVDELLCIGIERGNVETVIDIARSDPAIHASVGVHPLDLADEVEPVDTLCEWADNPEVIAIGETGLDYYYSADNAERQRESFKHHLQASARTGKPTIVHTRDARDDTIRLIRDTGDAAVGGVLHCFTESLEMARQALDLNYYISFSGIITFKNAAELREVVKAVPLDKILVETDSPYLAPVPYRGKKNEPKYVVEVAHCVAELKQCSFEEVAAITTENFHRCFNLSG